MQDVEQEVEHHNQRGGVRIKEIEGAGENRQHDVGPEENLQFAPAVGEDFRQHAANHHPDHAEADKQGGKMGALSHHPGDVIHGGGHANKARADVAQREQQDAHPLVIFPHVFEVFFQFIIRLHRRVYAFTHGSEAEQEHTHADKGQHGHRHLVALRFIGAAEPVGHWQQRQ